MVADWLVTLRKFYLTGASHGHPTQLFDSSSTSKKSNPRSSSSLTWTSTSIDGLLLTPSQTSPTPHYLSVLLPTVSTFTSFISYAWQHALCMSVCLQPVSSRAVRCIPLICTVIVDSALFKGDLGRRLAPKSCSASCPDSFRYVPASYINSTKLVFRI